MLRHRRVALHTPRIGRLTAVIVGSLVLAGLLTPFSASAAGGAAPWPQFGFDAAHSGANTAESTINAGNVGQLAPAFTAQLPGTADGPAAYRPGVTTANGTQDLLFTTTKDGWITATDAHTGSRLWTHQNGAGTCLVNNSRGPCYTTSSPAIDPSGVFVYSYGLDGKVHKHATGSGDETTNGGWPEVTTLKPFDEKGSSALAIATSQGVPYLYVTNGGYPGDQGDYQGHVTTIDLGTGTQNVFNTICSDRTIHFTTAAANDCSVVQSAVWARPGVVYDAGTDKVYLATGNSRFDGIRNFGDSVLQINPNGTGANGGPTDSYTPANEAYLDTADLDLGSTAPAVLHAPAGSSLTHLAVQSGKDGMLRLLNLDNLSGQGGPGHLGGEVQLTAVPQGGEVLTQPAAWVDPTDGSSWVFVSNDNGISGLKVVATNGTPSLRPQWTVRTGGTTPIVANGVLYYLTGGGARALNPTTGAQLWSDNAGNIGLHWQSPIVANGYLYYPDGNGKLRAFTLPTAAPTQANLNVRLDAPVFTNAGQTVTTTVTVANSGPGVATNVQTTLALPPGFKVLSAPNGKVTGGTVVFTAATIAADPISYPVTVQAPNAFSLGFTIAYALADSPDPFIFDNVGFALSVTG